MRTRDWLPGAPEIQTPVCCDDAQLANCRRKETGESVPGGPAGFFHQRQSRDFGW